MKFAQQLCNGEVVAEGRLLLGFFLEFALSLIIMPPKRAAAAAKQEGDATDYAKLKVADLKAECKKRGLDITGKKQDLIDRLKQGEDQGAGGKKVPKLIKIP